MVNYQNGKIYKLVNNVDDEIYIGSTCNPLSKRKCDHKGVSKQEKNKERTIYKHLNNIGWENVEIILIETCSCENKDELHKRERYWIDELKPSLNKVLPGRTRKEYYKDNKIKILEDLKEYHKNNKEKKSEYNAKYNVINKEKLAEKQKEYRFNNEERVAESDKKKYQKNKEMILEKAKIKITCECGSIIRKSDISAHKKTKKHKDYLETLNQ